MVAEQYYGSSIAIKELAFWKSVQHAIYACVVNGIPVPDPSLKKTARDMLRDILNGACSSVA